MSKSQPFHGARGAPHRYWPAGAPPPRRRTRHAYHCPPGLAGFPPGLEAFCFAQLHTKLTDIVTTLQSFVGTWHACPPGARLSELEGVASSAATSASPPRAQPPRRTTSTPRLPSAPRLGRAHSLPQRLLSTGSRPVPSADVRATPLGAAKAAHSSATPSPRLVVARPAPPLDTTYRCRLTRHSTGAVVDLRADLDLCPRLARCAPTPLAICSKPPLPASDTRLLASMGCCSALLFTAIEAHCGTPFRDNLTDAAHADVSVALCGDTLADMGAEEFFQLQCLIQRAAFTVGKCHRPHSLL